MINDKDVISAALEKPSFVALLTAKQLKKLLDYIKQGTK